MLNRLKEMLPRRFKREARRILQNVLESMAYRLSRERVGVEELRHVVFVCKGNTCRSAFAEYYLKTQVPGGGIRIESCGLDVDQGSVSPPDAVQAGRDFGIDLDMHRAKGFVTCDLQNADLILTMEYRQYLKLRTIFPVYKEKIRLLREFAPWADRLVFNIFDPYGLGADEFRRCFLRMQRALDGLKNSLSNTND